MPRLHRLRLHLQHTLQRHQPAHALRFALPEPHPHAIARPPLARVHLHPFAADLDRQRPAPLRAQQVVRDLVGGAQRSLAEGARHHRGQRFLDAVLALDALRGLVAGDLHGRALHIERTRRRARCAPGP